MNSITNSFWLDMHFSNKVDEQISKKRKKVIVCETSNKEIEEVLISPFETDEYEDVLFSMMRHLGFNNSRLILDDYIKFDFINTPSVSKVKNPEIKHASSRYKTTHPEFRKTARTNLLAHTFNVAKEVIEKNYEEGDTKIILLFALVHDAGKSKSLMEYYEIYDSDIHHEILSAYYVKKLFKSTNLEKISNMLSKSLIEKDGNNFYYTQLRECDKSAREKEQLNDS